MRALSFLDGSAPRTSTMTVVSSDLGDLGPDPDDDPTDSQVHGNMLHRGITDTPSASTRGPRFDRVGGHVDDSTVRTPAGTAFVLRGTGAARTDLAFRGAAASAVRVGVGSYRTATFR